MSNYYGTLKMYRELRRQEEAQIWWMSVIAAIMLTILIGLLAVVVTAPMRDEAARLEQKCWTMHGKVAEGKCWIDNNGDRKVLDLKKEL